MEIENDRIVASLTVGEYKEVLNSVLGEKLKEKDGPHEFGFGLKCIQDHFGVSKGTIHSCSRPSCSMAERLRWT